MGGVGWGWSVAAAHVGRPTAWMGRCGVAVRGLAGQSSESAAVRVLAVRDLPGSRPRVRQYGYWQYGTEKNLLKEFEFEFLEISFLEIIILLFGDRKDTGIS